VVTRTTIDVIALHAALDAARESRNLSWRQLAREIEVSPSTMSRLANGLKPDVNAFVAMVRWLNLPAERFMVEPNEGHRAPRDQPDLVAELAPLLRARKDLTKEDVEHLEQIIGSAVRRFKADRTHSEG
jgi:transcriptional regulator with XRE-family HTH domain